MAFTYDVSTDAGKVRMITADSRDDGHILEDDEVAAFLALNGGNVRLAAADALETIASNESLVQKAMKLLDVQTNGPAVAADLRKAAATQRALAAGDLAAVNTDMGFDIAFNPATTWQDEEYAWHDAVVQSA